MRSAASVRVFAFTSFPSLGATRLFSLRSKTPAQFVQFRRQPPNALLPPSRLEPKAGTAQMRLRNIELEAYAREAADRRRVYYKQYAEGRDKRVEGGIVKRAKREKKEHKWNIFLDNFERNLNPLKFMTAEQKAEWDRRRARIDRNRLLKRTRGQIRSGLASQEHDMQKQKCLSFLMEKATNAEFLLDEASIDRAIDCAIANPATHHANLTWTQLEERERKRLAAIDDQMPFSEPEKPEIDPKLFPRGELDVLPKHRRPRQLV